MVMSAPHRVMQGVPNDMAVLAALFIRLSTIAEGLATAWLDAKMADIVASRAIYGIAAEFDLSEMMGKAASCMTELIDTLLAHAPDTHFADRASVAFMLAALLSGSVRAVMEAEASQDNFARLRRELPRACRAYLALADQGLPRQKPV